MPTQANVQWSRNLYATLTEGGVWAVPRSGLLFKREGGGLVLSARLPGFPQAEQDSDVAAIKEHFEAAGIPVTV